MTEGRRQCGALIAAMQADASPPQFSTTTAQPQGHRPGVALLPVLVLILNAGAAALTVAYSMLNLRPELEAISGHDQPVLLPWLIALAIILPVIASTVFLWPIMGWRRKHRGTAAKAGIPPAIALRAASIPISLAAISLGGWLLFMAANAIRLLTSGIDTPAGLVIHILARPLLGGVLVATTVFFVAEYVCRNHVWTELLSAISIAGNPRLRRVRVSLRLLMFWLAASVLPLAAVALTTYARFAGADDATDPLLIRVVAVVLLIAISAALVGAALAWLVYRSVARPLERLEAAMARLRDGNFDTREPVNATDEIGALIEGFNLMAGRLSRSYSELAQRNRELAQALDKVEFLERVKHGLDRFVPETVRRAIETNPDAPGLAKQARDVSVLFLDIVGYARLSEELPRPTLNSLVERYFSLFMAPIREQGGDISETAGDGLMIVFQAADPQAHARAAVNAALAMQRQTASANRDAGSSHPPIQIHVGIASGECDVGTTRFHGAAGDRWTYTASGPVTNLAARLCGQAHGGEILISTTTADRVRDLYPVTDLGPIAPKNVTHLEMVWRVTDAAGET